VFFCYQKTFCACLRSLFVYTGVVSLFYSGANTANHQHQKILIMKTIAILAIAAAALVSCQQQQPLPQKEVQIDTNSKK